MPKKGFKSITISEKLIMEIEKIQKSSDSYKNKTDVVSIAIQPLSEKLKNKNQNRKAHPLSGLTILDLIISGMVREGFLEEIRIGATVQYCIMGSEKRIRKQEINHAFKRVIKDIILEIAKPNTTIRLRL